MGPRGAVAAATELDTAAAAVNSRQSPDHWRGNSNTTKYYIESEKYSKFLWHIFSPMSWLSNLIKIFQGIKNSQSAFPPQQLRVGKEEEEKPD
jgi:hypothetical protein